MVESVPLWLPSEQDKIKVEHISSHKGTVTPEQIGNDAADRLANNFRLQGEASQPTPYLLLSEESLLFQHNDTVVNISKD